jgi:hypothetical protein
MNEGNGRDHRAHPGGTPGAPVLVKHGPGFSWPEDERLFYMVASGGLYVCRNHEFFRSCVRAGRGPGQLEEQKAFLTPRFPRIPQAIFEQSVGFFSDIADRHGSEAAALLLWDRVEQCVRLHVPEQTASVSRYSDGYVSPIGVHYTPPTDLPTDWIPFGDIHCHVGYSAYASATDKDDELHSAGLHIVVGRIHDEPPDLHVEAVVDGQRHRIDPRQVIEGYRERRVPAPESWIDRVRVEDRTYVSWLGSAS